MPRSSIRAGLWRWAVCGICGAGRTRWKTFSCARWAADRNTTNSNGWHETSIYCGNIAEFGGVGTESGYVDRCGCERGVTAADSHKDESAGEGRTDVAAVSEMDSRRA